VAGSQSVQRSAIFHKSKGSILASFRTEKKDKLRFNKQVHL